MFSNISLLIQKYSQGFGDPVTYNTGYTNRTVTHSDGLCVVDVSAASLICSRIVTE